MATPAERIRQALEEKRSAPPDDRPTGDVAAQGFRRLDSPESRRTRDRIFTEQGQIERERELETSRAREKANAPPRGNLSNFARQAARGVVNVAEPVAQAVSDFRPPVAGAPKLGRIAEMIGAPTSAQELAERSGGVIATEEPTTVLGSAGRGVGAAGAASVPIGKGASLVSRSTEKGGSIFRRFLRGARNVISDAGQAFRQSPGRFVQGEAVLGASAGVGGLAAVRRFPESESARFVGETLFGVGPQVAPLNLAVQGAKKARDVVRGPFSGAGPKQRAGAVIRGVTTPGELAAAQRGLDEPTTLDPETGRPVLSEFERTEGPGLLALQKSILSQKESDVRLLQDHLARANEVIQESARSIGRGVEPEAAAGNIQEAQRHLSELLRFRLQIAAARTDDQIAKLGRGASREEANRIARKEVEEARRAGRDQEDELFNAVDPNMAVPTSSAQARLDKWVGLLGQDQQKNIPALAKRRFDPGTDESPNRLYFGETATVKDIRAVQSELREQARIARSNNKAQKAKIADDIADGIAEDIESMADESEALRLAVDFSREFKQMFRRGAVGRLLGRERTGGQSVRPGETLERSIAGGGPGEREALDEIRAALDQPRIAEARGAGSAEFNEAAGDFVRRLFLRQAAPDGAFNPKAARAFVRDKDELLKRMPGLAEEFDQAISTGNVEAILEKTARGVKLDDPKVSRAALFVHKGPVAAFRAIADDAPDFATRETQKLVNRAKKDPTGRAVQGLKSGYVDFLLQPSGARDVAGQPLVDGFALRELRNTPSVKAMEQRLLSPAERKRLDIITTDLVKLERARTAQPIPGGPEGISDQPAKLVQRLSRIGGAAAGRTGGARLGVGGTVQIPGQVADIFNDLAKAGFKDPTGLLIRDAIRDEDLFRELLQAEITPDGELPKRAVNRLQAWAVSRLNEAAQRPEPPTIEEQRSDEPPAVRIRRSLERRRRGGE